MCDIMGDPIGWFLSCYQTLQGYGKLKYWGDVGYVIGKRGEGSIGGWSKGVASMNGRDGSN